MVRGYLGGNARRGSLIALSVAFLIGCGGRYKLGKADDPRGGGGEGGAPEATGGSTAASANGGTTGATAGTTSATGGTSGAPTLPPDGPYAQRIEDETAARLDLLLVIDNSPSMQEKQRILANSLPSLLERLARPACLDRNGNRVGRTDQSGVCEEGLPEFAPLSNTHVGVITSSLGSHGSDRCVPTEDRNYDDRAQFVGSVRNGLPSWADEGFLAWSPRGVIHVPPGYDDLEEFSADAARHVEAAGDLGCDYPSSLEAWYRFLIDPEPVERIEVANAFSVRSGVNQTILHSQRNSLLREQSLVAIVMLSDENDCSVLDETGSQGWLVGFSGIDSDPRDWRMPPATASCADPNSPCCRSCASEAPAGCPSNEDERCDVPQLPPEADPLPLRCFDQRRRFGVDLLYPVERYVEALTSPTIDPRLDGSSVPNPLFTGVQGRPPRTRDQVFVAGIVGVPWQDVATNDTLEDPRALRLLPASELDWSLLLGNAAEGVPPTDPFMRESQAPGSDTLQFACTLPGTDGASGATPSLRQLEVLKGLGSNAVVGSICPKNAESDDFIGDRDYGYNPILHALADRMAPQLQPQCLDRELPVAAANAGERTSCRVVIALPDSCGECNPARGHYPLADEAATQDALIAGGFCGGDTGIDCDLSCLCEVEQLTGAALTRCQTSLSRPASEEAGFCYVSDQVTNVEPALLSQCPEGSRQRIRFVGPDVRPVWSGTFLVCPAP